MFGTKIDNESLRLQIAQDALDRILQRAESGVDVDGKRFKGYSKKYIESDDFKAFGKTPGRVNLRLTGDMLDLMDVIEDDPNSITIGWTDPDEALKATGHIKGEGNLPKRDFFGLTNKEIDELKRLYKKELEVDETFEESILLEGIRGIGEG